MSARVGPARLLRMCLKELRESLRDRRTIVTLVLMPLLVYPLLSLVLNRVLLTNFSGDTKLTVSIGVGAELKQSQLPRVLELGYSLLMDRESSPVYLEEVVQEGQASAALEATPQLDALPEPQLMVLRDSGREALRSRSVDVVITRRSNNSDANFPHTEATDSTSELATEPDDPASEPDALPPAALQLGSPDKDTIDPQSAMRLLGSYDVRYRQGDQQSERALQLLERMLAAVNNLAAGQAAGPQYDAPFRILATPVAMKSSYADILATMVPLVLVLMTMAGAVYPAIDLTAGERERGTMEALIISPTPTSAILLAKYSAVVTVALLTALANLAAMTITLWISGIGKLVFGDGILSAGVVGTVLVLLVLFTMFFAALLLAVTSFAKSFKEAQAYLIPLMLLALTPGVMSLMPGLKFTGILATVPLVNIVLLARQILLGTAEWNTALIAVICNALYALAALAVASRLFGSDASMHGSQGSWRDLLMRPVKWAKYPTVDQMAMTMAGMFPLYFVASSAIPPLSSEMSDRLWISAVVSFALLMFFPACICWYRRIAFVPTFRLAWPTLKQWSLWLPAVLFLGVSAWMAAHEIFIAGRGLGIGSLEPDKLKQVLSFKEQLQQMPLWIVLFVFALTPAVCEEFLFRGFVLSSLNRYSVAWSIILSSILFGLMHVVTSNVLAIERFLPSTFMGLILAWLACRTRSLWPGMLLHCLHNGLLLSLLYYQKQLERMNWFVEEETHLPANWLVLGAVLFVLGGIMIWLTTRPSVSTVDTLSLSPVEQPA